MLRDQLVRCIITIISRPRLDSNSVPLAFYAHGGTFTIDSKDALPGPQRQKLVELGFVVVSPNYRLGPIISASDGPVADVKDCYTWAKKELPTALQKETQVKLDPTRVVALGHSCGGTLALLLVSYHHDKRSHLPTRINLSEERHAGTAVGSGRLFRYEVSGRSLLSLPISRSRQTAVV